MITLDLSILNQKGTPMFNSDLFANRPAAGIVGRIFISTDTKVFFRDTGTTWEELSGSSFTGSLATGQVAFGSALNTISGTNNLFWDNANGRLGIGTNTPNGSLHIVKSSVNDALLIITPNNNSTLYPVFIGGATLTSDTYLRSNASTIEFSRIGQPSTIRTVGAGTNNLVLQSGSNLVLNANGANEGMRITTSLNTLVGGIVDAGQRFQVYGDSLLRGSGSTSATTALTIQNSGQGNLFRVFNDSLLRLGNAGTLGIAIFPFSTSDSSPDINGYNLSIFTYDQTSDRSNGSINITGTQFSGTSGTQYNVLLGKSFVPSSGTANYANLVLKSTINQTGGANGISRGLFIVSNLISAFDWRSIQWDNNSGFGLYGSGTALNYLGGSLGIKTTAHYVPTTFSLDVNGGVLIKNTAGTTAQLTLINANPALGGNEAFIVHTTGGTSGSSYADLQGYYGASITGSTAIRLNPAGGSVIVNSTTNSGEQFQLTGTIRVNGQRSGTAGGASGQHLIINCDGVSYKIALLNP